MTFWAGYKSGYQYLGSWSGLSVGLGYEYQVVRGLYFGIDALYLSYGNLGGSERISASLRYEPVKTPPVKTAPRGGPGRRHVH